jgi:chromosome segregation ATPase
MIGEHVKTSQVQQKSNVALTEKFSQQIERLDFSPAVTSLKNFGTEVGSLTTQVELLAKVTGQTEAGVATMMSSIFRATTELDKTTEGFSRYQSIENDFDAARESILQITKGALSLKETLDESGKLEILTTITELDSRANSVDQALEKTNAQIDRLSDSTLGAQGKLDDSLGKLNDSTEVIDHITKQLSQLEELSATLSQTKHTVQSLREEVEEINGQITIEIRTARKELSKTSEMAADILKLEIAPITRAIKKVSEDFDPIERNLHNLDIRVRKSVSDVLDFLNK